MNLRMLLLGGALALAVLDFVIVARGMAGARPFVKPLPAVLLGLWVLAEGGSDLYARALAVGFFLSALGDLLLIWPRLFQHGVFAFLLAHVCYVVAFASDAREPQLLRALPFLLYGCGMFAFLRPGLGALAPAVGAYVVAICSMLWRAAARVGHAGEPTQAEWSGFAGAVIFAASDSLIALDRFHAPIAGVQTPIMLLYWIGQLGIAWSAVGR